MPGWQSPEQVGLLCPSLAPKAPASQGRQFVPAASAYVPFPHGVHASLSYWRVVPGGQRSQIVPSMLGLVPAAQGLQLTEPGFDSPFVPHEVQLGTPPRLKVLRGQTLHCVLLALEWFPTPQIEQNDAPGSGAT